MRFLRIARFRERGTALSLALCLLVALTLLALATTQAMANNTTVRPIAGISEPAADAAAVSGNAAGVSDASIVRPVVRAKVLGPGGTVEPEYKKYWLLQTATVYITPYPGYRIATISDNGKRVPPVSPYKIHHIHENHDIVVTFRVDPFTVDASAPGGGGEVHPTRQWVYYGHTAVIDIDPDPGYYTQSITDNGASMPVTDPYYIHNVDRDHNVVVTFATDTFTVDASVSGGNGSVSPPTQTVDYWGTASITIIPDTGYQTATITDNGVSKPISSPYVINNVMEDHDVVVTFHITDYMFAASGVGGNPVKSSAKRRMSVRLSAGGDSVRPRCSRRRCTNASIAANLGLECTLRTGGSNDQCFPQGAPARIQRRIVSRSCSVSGLRCESGGGINSSLSFDVIRRQSSLASRRFGKTAACPPRSCLASASTSRRSSASRLASSGPWQ